MTEVTRGAVAQAMDASSVPVGADRAAALRTLKDMRKKDDSLEINDQTLQLWLCLKSLNKQVSGRAAYVTLEQMPTFKRDALSSSFHQHELWVVHKHACPQLTTDPKYSHVLENLVDPMSIAAADWPAGLRPRRGVACRHCGRACCPRPGCHENCLQSRCVESLFCGAPRCRARGRGNCAGRAKIGEAKALR